MQLKKIKVFAPATIANVGPGFDVLGLALEQPGDIVIAERQTEAGLVFALENERIRVPPDLGNVAAHVASLMLAELKPAFGVALTLQKQMPLGSGMGSSAASSVAAALAVNALLPQPLARVDLLRYVVEGERLACGVPHADNVAPALLGGICLIRSYAPLDVIRLPISNNLIWIVVHPHIIIETRAARALLPTAVPLAVAIQQSANLAALIAGLMANDPALIAKSLHDDIAEPVRAKLIPGFAQARLAALQAGALSFAISGSGPAVFAIATSSAIAQLVANSIKQVFADVAHVDSDTYLSHINQEGATVQEITP